MAEIVIDGDQTSQRAVRWAVSQLQSAAGHHGVAVTDVRGPKRSDDVAQTTWQTDVFVLPAVAGIAPDAARVLLGHRMQGLPDARQLARLRGFPGARFPWTPAVTTDVGTGGMSEVIETADGWSEEHPTADAVWGAMRYVDWTGDESFLHGQGARLLTETARYWAARLDVEEDGSVHLRDVMGPDSRHRRVDDNAYTNNMVSWHLSTAGRHGAGAAHERERWTTLAGSLATGYDPILGRHHQFIGADVTRAFGQGQPDVLLLHHLLPGQIPAGSLAADLDHHLPRTALDDPLAAAICAGLLARAGRPDHGLDLIRRAWPADPGHLAGSSDQVPMEAAGALVQSVVSGFAGIRPSDCPQVIGPHLPRNWRRLVVRLQHHGASVTVSTDHDTITVTADRPTRVRIHEVMYTTPACVSTRLPRRACQDV